jgi:tRNA threonylcarbamoyladenosine biosynthesis protein TsaB
MNVLALDTTTRQGSAALLDDDRIVDERPSDPTRTHAERLPAEALALLAAHDLALSDVDLFAVAAGPGSFTGLRVGIATMQGFAIVGSRPLVGVSALEAIAHAGSVDLPAGARVAVWMDGHRREVFAALYGVIGADLLALDRLVEIDGPTVGDPAATLDRWRTLEPWPALFVGDGAALYADTIAGARVLPSPPLAATIGRLALGRWRAGTAAGVEPLYVRRPDAEIARDEKNTAHHGGH